MKILILYTPRSGTNAISAYFLKQNPNYKYFNQPFTTYQEEGITRASYRECLEYNDVLVKSEITNFVNLDISINQILLDFDKVLLISRQDKREQSISHIMAQNTKNFLSNKKRNHYVDGLDIGLIDSAIKSAIHNHGQLIKFMNDSFKFFYYEDLFYGSFSELLEYLEIEYKQDDFDQILNVKNKYRREDLATKCVKTLV